METVGDRIKAFRESRGLTQKQIYQATNGAIKQTSLSAVEKNQAKPGFDTLAALLAAYPALRSDWLLRGDGVMLATGAPEDDYTPPTALRLTAHGPPTATPPMLPDMLDKMLTQISEQARQHRSELAATKREARVQTDRATSFLEYTISTMSSTITTLKETIAELKQQVYGLQLTAGQRMPTPEEQAYFDAQAAGQKKSNPAGFKNYDNQPVSLFLAA